MLHQNDEQEKQAFGSVFDSHPRITQTILKNEIQAAIPAAQNLEADDVSLPIPLFVSMVPVDRMSPRNPDEAVVASRSDFAIGGGVVEPRL